MRTRLQQIAEARVDIAEYVSFRKRHGEPLSFAAALRAHREQCRLNLVDSSEEIWRDRLSVLDELALQEGLSP